jgi:hypothetical protein
METKSFTPDYVKLNWKKLSDYCIQDAKLTERLGVYLVKKLEELGIEVSTLYSCASITYNYFNSQTKINTALNHWYNNKKAFAFACDAYEGGKFEITSRGRFTGCEYDISSAYPYEIQNLIDIETANVTITDHYTSDSTYSFLRVFIDNTQGYHLPCGLAPSKSTGPIRTYPAGQYFLTITKEEYEYIKTLQGVKIDVLESANFYVNHKIYPYKKIIHDLYTLKSEYKKKDEMLYNVTKILQNSFYGKLCQATETHDNKIFLGPAFNPVHAAVITANTRIKIAKIQNLYRSDPSFECYAVHTDSVISNKPIPNEFISSVLGGFEFVSEGKGIIIACGIYQMGDACAFKGMKSEKDAEKKTWEDILKLNPKATKIPHRQVQVESWFSAMARNHELDKINVFTDVEKSIDLNGDLKRVWPTKFKAKDFLNKIEHSLFKMELQTEPPKNWSQKFDN